MGVNPPRQPTSDTFSSATTFTRVTSRDDISLLLFTDILFARYSIILVWQYGWRSHCQAPARCYTGITANKFLCTIATILIWHNRNCEAVVLWHFTHLRVKKVLKLNLWTSSVPAMPETRYLELGRAWFDSNWEPDRNWLFELEPWQEPFVESENRTGAGS